MENQANLNADHQNNETLINTFCEITSSSKSEALFFLESHNFDLDSAVSTFLENAAVAVDDTPASASASVPAAVPAAGSLLSPTDSRSYSPSRSESSSPSRSRSPSPPSSRRLNQSETSNAYNLRSSRTRNGPGASAGRRGGRIHTVSDLKSESSGSDSDEPEEYYTGGEESGMLVQDPSKPNDVDAIFKEVRRYAAVPSEHLPSSSSRSFTGTSRRLTGETVFSAPQPPERLTHNITFWSNGFTVDDGPLRSFDDPENATFLESIRKSECPKELEPADRTTPVRVNLTRREENCPVLERQRALFQGVGRTLGRASDPAPVESTVTVSSFTAAPAPSVGLIVDQTQPSTSIQLRLSDGTRMISRFNFQHTIRDIRGFIDASRPGGQRSYQLQTVGFPPKQLTDLDQTIEQAGLANSVVIQKL